jgi:hypothetical protein
MTTATSATTPPSPTSPAGSPTGGRAADESSPTPPDTMADPPLRAVAYIRESTEEQEQGFSPMRSASASASSRPRTTWS